MRLEYKLFGKVATLIRYRRVPVDGDTVTLKCAGAESYRLYSEARKATISKKLSGGEGEIPTSFLEGGVSVSFYLPDGSDAWGTPLKLESVGAQVYVVGGEFSNREAIERLQDSLLHAVEVAEEAQKKAERVTELEKRLGALEKRANSGDIINF